MEKKELSLEEKVKSDALLLLSVRPRSVEELRGRLKLKRHAPELIEGALELLQSQGLLNDEKFAQVFAGSKTLSRPVGRRQLEVDLKKKGIAPALIQTTLSKLVDYDEKEAVRKLVTAKISRMKDVPPQKVKARLFGFLKRRGFSSEVIFSVFSEILKDGSQVDES